MRITTLAGVFQILGTAYIIWIGYRAASSGEVRNSTLDFVVAAVLITAAILCYRAIAKLPLVTKTSTSNLRPETPSSKRTDSSDLSIDLKKKAVLVSPFMGSGVVTFSNAKNRIMVECYLICFTPISTKYIEVTLRTASREEILKFSTREKFSAFEGTPAKLTLKHTLVDEDEKENLDKFFRNTTNDTPVNVELYIEFDGPEVGDLWVRRTLQTLLVLT